MEREPKLTDHRVILTMPSPDYAALLKYERDLAVYHGERIPRAEIIRHAVRELIKQGIA